MMIDKSIIAFERAKRNIAGGVNSPVRAFKAVGGTPVFAASAVGSSLVDLDGNRYIDYVMSWGPLILGHAHPSVVEAVRAAAQRGLSFGMPTDAESDLAELVCTMVPSIERVRFVSSGTEATMSALRLARAFTGRTKVVKFAGCYHGHADAFLISAGSGALTHGAPDSPGVTPRTAEDTIVLPYNDLDAIHRAFEANADEIAAVIVEPYAGNMGLVLPQGNFLAGLREVTRRFGALLIFDEVMTGFRVAPGGAQEREGILPDLTCLGKIVGGGLPVGAFGGRVDIMRLLSPRGEVYQAGTLSGNPLAMAAGYATLRALDFIENYQKLDHLGRTFTDGLSSVFQKYGIAHQIARAGSMVGFFFTNQPVVDLESAKSSDTALYAHFFHAMLQRGVYFPPSQFEAMFLSLAHTEADINRTIAAVEDALQALIAKRLHADSMV
ncbi:MAG TPA: glutamate-1-semialdehyde 2,1-aminomutase [Candidatus Baltobacteraceae bacterium]|jgi:glutamate-1-semialdehyde 2,1-aminomutase|nr:glutamate-1-semialdehyde 2,1-aminomutase [Candidatus Baltobacteraceae bacterium]